MTDTYDGSKHRTSHQTYYKDDRIKTITDTFGKVTTYSYNDTLRQTKIVNPLGLTTTKTYDKVGNLINTTDSQNRTTQYGYDELNRQKTITDAEGGITNYTYYNDGKTRTIKDAVNNTTTYIYDAASRLTQEQTVDGNRTYGYDEVNNRTSTVDRNGRTTNYDYDNLDRVKSETWAGTGKQFTYTYDKNSNQLSADDGAIKYNYTYDNTDLLTQVDRISGTNPTISFQYEYDKVGNLTKSDELTGTTVSASTAYTYNSRNLNTQIVQTGVGLASKQVKFSYDTTGQTTKIERYANGQLAVTTTDTYDSFGRLIGIEQNNSGGVIASSLYEFDNLNRLTSETIDGVNRLIGYDKIDQVKTVTGSNSEAYTYDANGNRTNNGYVTGANNKLLSDGTYNYEYDKEGNRTKRTNIATGTVDDYTWDYRNRLTGVISKDGSGAGAVTTQTVSYEYDVDNERVSKTVNGVVEKYIIDRNQIAYVTDASGTQTFHYLYGTNVDAVMAQDSPTGMVWSLSDRLGSVNLLTDAGGVVVDKRTFDSFGRVLSETNPGVKFRYGYTGREQDGETGLDYYRARYYDAANGRFISVDPIGFGAGDTNLYRYVGNRSTLATDPSGLNSTDNWFLDMTILAVVGFVGTAVAIKDSVSPGLNALKDYIGSGEFGNSISAGANQFGNTLNGTIAGANQFGRALTDSGFNPFVSRGTGMNPLPSPFPNPDRLPGTTVVERFPANPGEIFQGTPGFDLNHGLSGSSLLERFPANPGEIFQGIPGFDLNHGMQIPNHTGNTTPHENHFIPVLSSISGSGEVVFNVPPWATNAQIQQMRDYCQGCNDALAAGSLSPTGRVGTKGDLRDDASEAARVERVRAANAGTPYQGVVGHVPDTTWVGIPNPPAWQDLDQRVNSSLGGQSTRYSIGYQPTHFRIHPDPTPTPTPTPTPSP